VALGLCLAAAAAAQEAPQAPPAPLPEVVVSATRIEQEGFGLPAAIDLVPGTAIREARPQVNLSEPLARVPGIVVQNRHNYAQDLQISARGFGARASFGVRGVRLLADGIPATMPDGQGQAASFNLSSAERIEVLRGPLAHLYGNAAGGVVQIFTADGPPEPQASASLLAGSFGTSRLGLQFGGSHPFNFLVDLSRFDTGGYREHSAARRDHLNAKLKFDAGTRGTLTLVANVLEQPQTQDPLGLTAAQFARDPRQAGANALAFDTRKSVAQEQLGAIYDLETETGGRLQARLYLGDRQVTQYLAIPLAAQGAPTSSGGVVDLDRRYGGAGLRWSQKTALAATPLVWSVGLDYDRMAERRKGFINNLGVAGALKRDEDDRVYNLDLYAQAEWRFAPHWTALAGARASRVRFTATDYFIVPGNPDDSGAARYARTTPALGLAYRPVESVVLYGNYGEGFETPTFAELAHRGAGLSGLNFALKPARSTHREAGVKLRRGAAGRIQLALFHIAVLDEIVVDSSAGGRTVFKNAAATRRKGLELAWQDRLPFGFELVLAATVLDARFAQPFTAGTPPVAVPAGNRLPGVPGTSLYGELLWRHAPSGFHAGVEARANGKVYVNDANSEAAAAYTVWNLRAGFEQRGRNWQLAEFVRVDNALDRRYAGSVIVAEANGRYYEPAPGRNWQAGVQASWRF
jgi:iron complex outermembrane receptor protein